MRTFPTILANSLFLPNLPYSPFSPQALIKFCQICHFRHCMASFAKFTTFATFAKSLGKILSNSPFSRLRAFLASSFAFVRTFPTILLNSPVSPNLPYSPLSPKALIKFCQICHFCHCMASFAKFTTFAAFAKSLGKILSNSPFSRLRAFLDISALISKGKIK